MNEKDEKIHHNKGKKYDKKELCPFNVQNPTIKGNNQYKLIVLLVNEPFFSKNKKTNNIIFKKENQILNFIPIHMSRFIDIQIVQENYNERMNLYKIIIVYEKYNYLREIALKFTERFHSTNQLLAGKLGTKEISDDVPWEYLPITISISKPPQVKETNNICPHCEKEIIRQNRRNHFDNCINLIFS